MGKLHEELVETVGSYDTFEMPFSASEGIFGIPFRPNETGALAAITSHFLEYIPEDEIDNQTPTSLNVWELQENANYYQVVTNAGGLYRYNMEDLIHVKGHWGQLPIVEFVSKKARQVSIANERLNERDVVEAYRKACTDSGFSAANFLMFPSADRRYKAVVENTRGDLNAFAEALEASLCHHSMGYSFEREDKLLKQTEVLKVTPGALEDYIARNRTTSSVPNAQVKPMYLSADFKGACNFAPIERAMPVPAMEA